MSVVTGDIVNSVLRDDCEVVVIGAGPYGLSLGAHLDAAGIDVCVFGRPMSFWREHMPNGMRLRSPWAATHIADPDDLLTLDAFAGVTCLGRPDPLPVADFIRYGDWFQNSALPGLDTRRVEQIESAQRGFRIRLDDGGALRAHRVVIAMGLANQQYRPAQFDGLPAGLVSHTADHAGLDGFRGQRVAVIGRGQSACESAALLAEAGAEVEIICRGDIRWLGTHRHTRLASISGAGPFPLNWINEEPEMVRGLPRGLRVWINTNSLRAAAAGWVKPRLVGVHVDAGRTVMAAGARGSTVTLDCDTGSREFDHVLLATGYKIDIARLGVLAPDLLAAIATEDGSPRLAEGYQSSVPGLHFIGASAAASYGALLSLVYGAGHAARAVARFVRANRKGRVSGWSKPSETLARRTETAANLN
jgi:thioredoxin reductase